MKKIINPWKGLEGYNCFGCAPNNEAGIKMEFYEDGDEVVGSIPCSVVFWLFSWMYFALGLYFVNYRQRE